MKVYGVTVSYYTGKLEAYLRYKGIPYTMDDHPFADQARIKEKVGAIQVPIVERDDGRWMSDTTPMLLQLEQEYPDPGILPDSPSVRFIALLLEDYADEWLWRAAMHYRWSYEHDRELLSRILTDEMTTHLKLPRFVRRNMVKRRQRQSFVVRDGVTPQTWNHVEQGYRRALANMTTMLADTPYLLGTAPSLADFGFMGPMLRHFGQDPTPAEIMRNEAPEVFDWLSRVWNARTTTQSVSFVSEIPTSANPMLQEIAETHLVQLTHNAKAFAEGRQHFAMTVQGCAYNHLPVSRYRVWCLEQLREAFAAMSEADQKTVQQRLQYPAAEVLWQAEPLAQSGYDEERLAPFNMAINVYASGTPE